MDGYELARRLRDEPRAAGHPAGRVTGYGQDTRPRARREAGFDAHLVKPVDLVVIGRVIADAAPN